MAATTVTHSTSLVEKDAQHVWHPFTQSKKGSSPLPVVGAEGSYLHLEDGRRILDGISSWWTCLHGHAHPYIGERLMQQFATLDHVLFAGFTHRPAVELSERLLELLPSPLKKVFFSDNGSTAVEVAIKMSFQYWYNRGEGQARKKMIAFKGSYHGDTFGSMSVAARTPFNKPFWPFLFDVIFVEPPVPGKEEDSLQQMREALKDDDIAAFIFEPLVQGAGGMVMHSAKVLGELMILCKEKGVLTIADEVMTGFGRTGNLFATQNLSCSPDIISLSKGISGGVMPLAVTACTQEICQMFSSEDMQKTFFHGHTYTANPLACAAGLASLDLLTSEECSQQRAHIEACHRKVQSEFARSPAVKDCRVQGTILAVEYNSQEESSYFNPIRDQLYDFFVGNDVLLRPLGNVAYVLPPYCITEEELNNVYSLIQETLSTS